VRASNWSPINILLWNNYNHHDNMHMTLIHSFVYLLLSRSRLCHYSVAVPGDTFVSVNRFSALCGWLAQRKGWRVKGWIWPSEQPRSAKANSWLNFKSSFTCRKILRHGNFPLYFPYETKVCCGFLSPLKIHRLGRDLNPQPLSSVASTLTTTPPRWQNATEK
jgi:hypothetical protein